MIACTQPSALIRRVYAKQRRDGQVPAASGRSARRFGLARLFGNKCACQSTYHDAKSDSLVMSEKSVAESLDGTGLPGGGCIVLPNALPGTRCFADELIQLHLEFRQIVPDQIDVLFAGYLMVPAGIVLFLHRRDRIHNDSDEEV